MGACHSRALCVEDGLKRPAASYDRARQLGNRTGRVTGDDAALSETSRIRLKPSGQVSNSLGGTTINGRPVCETGGSTCVFPHSDERSGVFETVGVCPKRAFQSRNVPATKG